MDIFELLDKQFERNLYVLEQLGEITGEEYVKLTIETLNKIPYSSELPSQQAKQTKVGEQDEKLCSCGGYFNDWHSHASDCPEINPKQE